ncbi:MAG TPA: LysR family transcriptional regulator [Bacteriovoracaceae bacterium]|nr:LysR family transcriptional regulator [Bacteriovoracaceae bacterium]
MNKLQTFKILAETRSFSQTAARLYVTQSAISQQIKILQESIGDKLVQKIANQIYLTPEGEKLYAKIQEPLNHLESSFREEQQVTPLRISGPVILMKTHLIDWIERFNQDCFYQFQTTDSEHTYDSLAKNQVHLGLVSKLLDKVNYRHQLAFTEKLYLAFNKKYHTHLARVDKKHSKQINWIDFNEHLSLFQRGPTKLKSQYRPSLKATLPNLESIEHWLCKMPAASILSEQLMPFSRDLEVGHFWGENRIYLLIHKNQKNKKAIEFFETFNNLKRS